MSNEMYIRKPALGPTIAAQRDQRAVHNNLSPGLWMPNMSSIAENKGVTSTTLTIDNNDKDGRKNSVDRQLSEHPGLSQKSANRSSLDKKPLKDQEVIEEGHRAN